MMQNYQIPYHKSFFSLNIPKKNVHYFIDLDLLVDYYLFFSEKQILHVLQEYIGYFNSKRPLGDRSTDSYGI